MLCPIHVDSLFCLPLIEAGQLLDVGLFKYCSTLYSGVCGRSRMKNLGNSSSMSSLLSLKYIQDAVDFTCSQSVYEASLFYIPFRHMCTYKHTRACVRARTHTLTNELKYYLLLKFLYTQYFCLFCSSQVIPHSCAMISLAGTYCYTSSKKQIPDRYRNNLVHYKRYASTYSCNTTIFSNHQYLSYTFLGHIYF